MISYLLALGTSRFDLEVGPPHAIQLPRYNAVIGARGRESRRLDHREDYTYFQ